MEREREEREESKRYLSKIVRVDASLETREQISSCTYVHMTVIATHWVKYTLLPNVLGSSVCAYLTKALSQDIRSTPWP